MKRLFTDFTLIASAIAAALLLVMGALYAAGYPAHIIFYQWAKGVAGTRADVLVSLKNACPLILTGLAAGIAFRSGVFNIGAEGQSILGSLAAITLATRLFPNLTSPVLAIPAALLFSAIGGAAWAFLPAVLDRFRGVPVVLSTILLNFIALQLLGLLLEGPLRTTTATQVIQSDSLSRAYLLPIILYASGGYLHAGFLIALALAAFCWLLQARTTLGFEILVTGLNPTAAQYAGMPVAARQFAVMLLSGAFAGVAGAIQLMGVEGGHYLNTHPTSYGYAGIAVALLGRLHAGGIVAAAIFFAFLDRGATNLEFFHLPLEVSNIVQALIVLIILIATATLSHRQTNQASTF